MQTLLFSVQIHFEHDVVLSRQRARQIAGLLGFDAQDQTRIATAVSELARNAFEYAGGGKVEIRVLNTMPQSLQINVSDSGPGIADPEAVLSGRYLSHTGMGIGLIGAKRLMDEFSLESPPGGGTAVTVSKKLPPGRPSLDTSALADIAEELSRRSPTTAFEEVQRQNQELIQALEDVRLRQAEVERLNSELAETNRGVMALVAELDMRAERSLGASETKTRFLSHMSHEFRTPLAAIVSLTDLLLNDGPELASEQQKQVKWIQDSARELLEVVNDLLDIAKIESGRLALHVAPFDVADMLGGLRGMFRPLAKSDAVELVIEEAHDFHTLETDEAKVSQILRNLIANALKFTERGEVRVTAEAGTGDTAIFTVRDTGVGIPAHLHESIFEEFYQVEGDHQRSVKGTGLGLPLCRRLATLLGGSIQVASESGQGSIFTLTIPRVLNGQTGSSEAVSSTTELSVSPNGRGELSERGHA